MTDRPILFSGSMVRAILEGRKTMTRRVLKPQPEILSPEGVWRWAFRNNGFVGATGTHLETFKEIAEHHYKMQPKDHLWVREAWRAIYFEDDYKPSELLHDEPIYYEADKYIRCTQRLMDISDIGKKRPSMFMPKWASRITLIVKDVRVERLQYISEEDAKNEGAEPILVPPDGGSEPYREGFHTLWDSINGKDKDKCWDANPYVAAISFEPILKNIEEVER